MRQSFSVQRFSVTPLLCRGIKRQQKLIEKTHMVFLPSQLDFLKAGGRVSNAAYLGANILGLKPIIEIIDGKLVGTKKYRGRDMKKICKRMMNEFLTEYDCHLEDFFMLHSYGLDKTIMKETENIAKEHGFQNIRWIEKWLTKVYLLY